MKRALLLTGLFASVLLCHAAAHAAGILTPAGSPKQPVQIRSHHVKVVINNGFAMTEVQQTFFNPNSEALEAVYSFPMPRSAALSEVTITLGEQQIDGEVLAKEEAQRVYKEERDQGNNVGLAEKNDFKTLQFKVFPVPAGAETRVRFLYYQPLQIDTGVGRYVYPLAEGGTDDASQQFWQQNDKIEGGLFSADLEVKSGAPVAAIRTPGFEREADIQRLSDGHFRVKIERREARLNGDLVLYYRLADNLPGRVEMLAYRADKTKPGTFMLIVTPGDDLPALTGGSDYLFILDTSGSMGGGKIQTLADGVGRAISGFNASDRFRIITFNSSAREVTDGWLPATENNVRRGADLVKQLKAQGGTNLYEGLRRGIDMLDSDRVTSVILVTDGVTNIGEVNPTAFNDLMKQRDVRLFGFLMGNNANWPLMKLIADASGGFYTDVSTADDLLGQVILARGKVTHEAMHDAQLTIDGPDVFETTSGMVLKKVYHGQQLVIFGRYNRAGPATVSLSARVSGKPRNFVTSFDFPQVDTSNPEIERLWALNVIEESQTKAAAGLVEASESKQLVRDMGVAFQIVTDETSMVVLSDQRFADRGIDRSNQRRIATERQAQVQRASEQATDARVDQQAPMFNGNAPSTGHNSRGFGHGAGALDPISVTALVMFGAVALRRRPRPRDAASR